MKTANRDPRVVEAIKKGTDLYAKGETESALQHLSALAEELPAVASLHGYLALFLSRAGRMDEAIVHGRTAAELSPGSETASLALFDALWKAGQYTEALDEMKRFVALGPAKEYSKMIKEWNSSEVESAPS